MGLAIIDRRVDFCHEVLRRGLEAADGKVDILLLGEDCGNQNGRMVSPRDFDEVFRREARHRLDVVAPGGGYIFAPAHCIQPDTPLDNVLAAYEEALGVPLI